MLAVVAGTPYRERQKTGVTNVPRCSGSEVAMCYYLGIEFGAYAFEVFAKLHVASL